MLEGPIRKEGPTGTSGAQGCDPNIQRTTKRRSRKQLCIYITFLSLTLAAVIPYIIRNASSDIAERGYFKLSNGTLSLSKLTHTGHVESERGLLKIPAKYIASYVIDKAKSSMPEATDAAAAQSSMVAAKVTNIVSKAADIAAKASSKAEEVHSKVEEVHSKVEDIHSEASKLIPSEIEVGPKSFYSDYGGTLKCIRNPSSAAIDKALGSKLLLIPNLSQLKSLLKLTLFINGDFSSAILIGFPLFTFVLYTLQFFKAHRNLYWLFARLDQHPKLRRWWLTPIFFAFPCISVLVSLVSLIVVGRIQNTAGALDKYYTVKKGYPLLICEIIGFVSMVLLTAILGYAHVCANGVIEETKIGHDGDNQERSKPDKDQDCESETRSIYTESQPIVVGDSGKSSKEAGAEGAKGASANSITGSPSAPSTKSVSSAPILPELSHVIGTDDRRGPITDIQAAYYGL